jgi:hypothetical protein
MSFLFYGPVESHFEIKLGCDAVPQRGKNCQHSVTVGAETDMKCNERLLLLGWRMRGDRHACKVCMERVIPNFRTRKVIDRMWGTSDAKAEHDRLIAANAT